MQGEPCMPFWLCNTVQFYLVKLCTASPLNQYWNLTRYLLKRTVKQVNCLLCWSLSSGPVLSCEAATQTEVKPQVDAVMLRKSLRTRALRSRPRSLIDYKSYIDTKMLVSRFLEQSSCSMTPDIHELVENIKSVLKSDEEHMAEAITSATFLEQVLLLTSWPWFGSLALHLQLCFVCQNFWTQFKLCGILASYRGRMRSDEAVHVWCLWPCGWQSKAGQKTEHCIF